MLILYILQLDDCDNRRNNQNKAIGYCYKLSIVFQDIVEILPCDVNKYDSYVELIVKEIALIKGWRKSDNKIRKRIQKQIDKIFINNFPKYEYLSKKELKCKKKRKEI